MAFLESDKMDHRDLRATSILCGTRSPMKLKLADKGSTRNLNKYNCHEEKDVNCTFAIKWTAPETATRRKWNIKSEVWSHMIIYGMRLLFAHASYTEIILIR